MDDYEGDDPFAMVVETLATVQGSGLATYHILLELVIGVARAQPNPSAFIKGMYESVSAKLDQTPLEMATKRASSEERETLSTFFSVAETAVRGRGQGKAGD
jgi:hypothetical protein